jgi:hypothetical protein
VKLRLALAAAVVLAATGCPPPPNTLDGSVKTSHDLSFDGEELRYLSDQKVYQLEYTRALDPENPESGTDIVAKITFNEPANGVTVDKEINLLDEAIAGRVERVTAANDPFPTELKKAGVTFHTAATVNETVRGEFAVEFQNGETLFGTFETKLTSVSF